MKKSFLSFSKNVLSKNNANQIFGGTSDSGSGSYASVAAGITDPGVDKQGHGTHVGG